MPKLPSITHPLLSEPHTDTAMAAIEAGAEVSAVVDSVDEAEPSLAELTSLACWLARHGFVPKRRTEEVAETPVALILAEAVMLPRSLKTLPVAISKPLQETILCVGLYRYALASQFKWYLSRP